MIMRMCRICITGMSMSENFPDRLHLINTLKKKIDLVHEMGAF